MTKRPDGLTFRNAIGRKTVTSAPWPGVRHVRPPFVITLKRDVQILLFGQFVLLEDGRLSLSNQLGAVPCVLIHPLDGGVAALRVSQVGGLLGSKIIRVKGLPDGKTLTLRVRHSSRTSPSQGRRQHQQSHAAQGTRGRTLPPRPPARRDRRQEVSVGKGDGRGVVVRGNKECREISGK